MKYMLIYCFCFFISCSQIGLTKKQAVIILTVQAAEMQRLPGTVITADFNFEQLTGNTDIIDPENFYLEKDDEAVMFEFEKTSDTSGRIYFYVDELMAVGDIQTWRLHLYSRAFQRNRDTVLQVDNVMDEDQNSFCIRTPVADYFYHIRGAAFSSIVDKDGNDWLNYNPGVGEDSESGSGGVYRGLPNMGYPEGYNHPGKTVSNSRDVSASPIRVVIESQSDDGKMKCRWEIFRNFARLEMLEMRLPFWFLYEGTPGGSMDMQKDYCVRMDGTKSLLAEKWQGDLQAQHENFEWLYFADTETERSLFLVNHDNDMGTDSYWPMNAEMTVFGFGRLGMEKYISNPQAMFTIGLVDHIAFNPIKAAIHSFCTPLRAIVD